MPGPPRRRVSDHATRLIAFPMLARPTRAFGSMLGCSSAATMHGVLGMEFSMRNSISVMALGAALMAATSVAHAQAVETIVTPAPDVMAAIGP